MAAPEGIVWGSIAYGKSDAKRGGRIGIYVTTSSTATETTATVQVWFWSRYSVDDSLGNHLYLDDLSASGSATTDRGGTDIHTANDSGNGWSTTNQVLLTNKSYTFKHTRGAKATRYLSAKLTGVDRVAATMTVSTSYTVPAAEYTVGYNANGGSGAPGSQKKTHGVGLTISSVVPTRTGYTFNNWALSKTEADNGRWYYTPGSTCGRNENLTLYAVWKANTYPVTYNANGGTGAPAQQTKTYGQTLALSSAIPTRPNYNFKGWATSASSTTAQYAPDASYTANSAATLYAVWELAYVKPRITNGSIERCDAEGNPIEDGTYARCSFTWACDYSNPTLNVEWLSDVTEDGRTSQALGGKSGDIEYLIFGNGTLNPEVTYTIKITVQDSVGYSTLVGTLSGTQFTIDFLAGGKGAAFGKPAELEGVLDVSFQTYLRGGLKYGVLENGTNLDSIFTTGFYVGSHTSEYVNCPVDAGNSFTLEVMSGGDIGQLIQRLTLCNMGRNIVCERAYYESYWGEWMKISPTVIYEEMLYTPSAAETFELVGSITIPKRTAFTITARGIWQNSRCHGIIISDRHSTDNGNHSYSYSVAACFNEDDRVFFPSCTYSGNTGADAITFYIWGKWQATDLNKVEVSGFYMPH